MKLEKRTFEGIISNCRKMIDDMNISALDKVKLIGMSIALTCEHFKELEAIRSEQDWIVAKERLPEDSGLYLVSVEREGGDPFVTIGAWIKNDGWEWFTMDTISAWMHLPEPFNTLGYAYNEAIDIIRRYTNK